MRQSVIVLAKALSHLLGGVDLFLALAHTLSRRGRQVVVLQVVEAVGHQLTQVVRLGTAGSGAAQWPTESCQPTTRYEIRMIRIYI